MKRRHERDFGAIYCNRDETIESHEEEAGKPSAAIIGAGVSGLSAARFLRAEGVAVRVYEKSRGPGGRLATRRRQGLTFDMGAQYLTIRDDRFMEASSPWIEAGVLASWMPRLAIISEEGRRERKPHTERFVGVPRMSALTRYLAEHLQVTCRCRIAELRRSDQGWRPVSDDGEQQPPADTVILALPAPQAAELLPDGHPLWEPIRGVRMAPCWAVMAAFPEAVPADVDAAFVNVGPLSWVARDSSKPGRDAGHCWVLHASEEWSCEHLDASPESVCTALLKAFKETVAPVPEPVHIEAHRWRYARAPAPLGVLSLWDEATRIGVCGDWCCTNRVEGAFRSGVSIAETVAASEVGT